MTELLELTRIGPNDLVIEIGPGRGIITRELLKRAGRVIAVERDLQFHNDLSILGAENCKLQLVAADFLEWQLPNEEYKVFSNIPFNLTADIVFKLTFADRAPSDMYLIMQEAAALRFAGMPYGRNSQVSVLMSIDFEVKVLRAISNDAFEPKPSVSVVFSHFDKRSEPLILTEQRQDFRDFVVYGYNQWVPTVIEAFRGVFSARQLAIIARRQHLGGLKPSELTLDQWIELFEIFNRYVADDRKKRVRGSEHRIGLKTQANLTKWHRTRRSA
mgnify:CR=1 FL=1